MKKNIHILVDVANVVRFGREKEKGKKQSANQIGARKFNQNYAVFVVYLIITHKNRVFVWPRFKRQLVVCFVWQTPPPTNIITSCQINGGQRNLIKFRLSVAIYQ